MLVKGGGCPMLVGIPVTFGAAPQAKPRTKAVRSLACAGCPAPSSGPGFRGGRPGCALRGLGEGWDLRGLLGLRDGLGDGCEVGGFGGGGGSDDFVP